MSAEYPPKSHCFLKYLGDITLIFWAGSCWALGYVFIPTLFMNFSHVESGVVAGRLFSVENMMGLICAMILLVDCRVRFSKNLLRQRGFWLLIFTICLLMTRYIALSPLMAQVKIMGDTDRFTLLHGLFQVVYLIQSVFLLFLVSERFKLCWMRK